MREHPYERPKGVRYVFVFVRHLQEGCPWQPGLDWCCAGPRWCATSFEAIGPSSPWRIFCIRSENPQHRYQHFRSDWAWFHYLTSEREFKAMVTTAAFVGAVAILIGLALCAFAIYLTDSRKEPQARGHWIAKPLGRLLLCAG